MKIFVFGLVALMCFCASAFACESGKCVCRTVTKCKAVVPCDPCATPAYKHFRERWFVCHKSVKACCEPICCEPAKIEACCEPAKTEACCETAKVCTCRVKTRCRRVRCKSCCNPCVTNAPASTPVSTPVSDPVPVSDPQVSPSIAPAPNPV